MTRVLLWKELREQCAIVVALVVAGVAVLAGIAAWARFDPVSERSIGDVMAVFFIWVFGLVAGAQPLAGEREAGTLPWLDALPVTRQQLWTGKVLFAGLVVVLQTVVLAAISVGLGFTAIDRYGGFALTLAVVSLNGLACGLFGSAVARSQFGAIGWAIGVQFVVGAVFVLSSQVLIPDWSPVVLQVVIIVSLSITLALTLMLVSLRSFTRHDRLRRPAVTEPGAWRTLVWLVWRQGRWLLLAVLAAGLVITLVLPATSPPAWPFFGLTAGVLCGMSAFAPDRIGQANCFLGDRRLPLGRVWLVKVGLWLYALTATFWPLESVTPGILGPHRSGQASAYEHYVWMRTLLGAGILALGPVYGFAVGLICGLACRKAVVACVLSVLVGGALVAVWLPSLVAGGLHWWQWVGPPLLLVAVTRLLMRPWVGERLAAWPTAAGVVACASLAVTGVFAGLWYRVAEIPAADAPFDVDAFVASVPAPEQNEAGRRLLQSLHQFEQRLHAVEVEFKQPKNVAGLSFAKQQSFFRREARYAPTGGWPSVAKELNAWMDRLFEGEWLTTLRSAAGLPPGVVSEPWPPTEADTRVQLQFHEVGQLLCARALQFQTRGEHAPALDMIQLTLATSRQIRHKAMADQYRGAGAVERVALETLCRWAAEAGGREELLRQAITLTREGEAKLPPLAETVKTEYVAVLEKMRSPYLRRPGESHEIRQMRLLAWYTPWETVRLHRAANALFADWLRRAARDDPTSLSQHFPAQPPYTSFLEVFADTNRYQIHTALSENLHNQVDWRVTQLRLALLLYERRHGRPAVDLNALVPEVLPELPRDPYGDGPFRYRVSAGEEIFWQSRPRPKEFVERGRGILWSVGKDATDDGGTKQSRDSIFLVPRPMKK